MPNEEKRIIDLGTLGYYDTNLKTWVEGTFKLVEQATAEDGYLKTYKLQFNGADVANSAKINIPKDFFLKSMTIKTCETADVPEQGYVVGDKYFDIVVNVADDSATARHIYLKVAEAFEAYVEGDGITINGQTISAKIGDGIQFNASTKAMEVKTGDGIGINATSKAVEAVISDNLQFTSGAIDIKEQNATTPSDANAPAVGGITKYDYVIFKSAFNGSSFNDGTEETTTSGNATTTSRTYTLDLIKVNGDHLIAPIQITNTDTTYSNATPTTESGGSTVPAAAGLMSGTDKDNLDALVDALGTDLDYATNADIDALFA